MNLLQLPPILSRSRTRVLFGAGRLAELGSCAKGEGAHHVLLVTDPGIAAAGHVSRALASLTAAAIEVTLFDGVQENPTSLHVDAGVRRANDATARGKPIDLIVGLGGGSAMDCAKGINFIHTNGGRMADYWGVGKAAKPMLPMIAVPTTAGTGSEAQSFALIADPVTHQKMACGDPKAACRLAILDPDLIATVPPKVAAAAGIDAVAHAVETAATTRRNETSLEFTQQAWARLTTGFERLMRNAKGDGEARALMLLGAHLAGAAIEHSMLGAAHACANPLTARCGIAHGVAVGIMLPHVVRFNCQEGSNPYDAIEREADRLVDVLNTLLATAKLPTRLSDCALPQAEASAHPVPRRGPDHFGSAAEPKRNVMDEASRKHTSPCYADCGEASPGHHPAAPPNAAVLSDSLLQQLAEEAAAQWTAGFNPVPVNASDLLSIYRAAL